MGDDGRKDRYLHVAVTEKTKKRFRAAAGAENKSLSQWVRDTLGDAVPDSIANEDTPDAEEAPADAD